MLAFTLDHWNSLTNSIMTFYGYCMFLQLIITREGRVQGYTLSPVHIMCACSYVILYKAALGCMVINVYALAVTIAYNLLTSMH